MLGFRKPDCPNEIIGHDTVFTKECFWETSASVLYKALPSFYSLEKVIYIYKFAPMSNFWCDFYYTHTHIP